MKPKPTLPKVTIRNGITIYDYNPNEDKKTKSPKRAIQKKK
jgi:hypothetical protein